MIRKKEIRYYIDLMNDDYPVTQNQNNMRTYNKQFKTLKQALRFVVSYYNKNKVDEKSVFMYRTVGIDLKKDWMI